MIASKKKITWSTFQKNYLSKEDKFKYEWINGQVEKSMRSWTPSNFLIQSKLQDLCAFVNTQNKIKGRLITYGDCFFNKNFRQPDFTYYTRSQMLLTANSESVIPSFVIEIINSKDTIGRIQQRIQDYRNAGVKIIWHLFPSFEEVHIYIDNALKMEVKRAQDICSAEPVIKGFKITVANIFKV